MLDSLLTPKFNDEEKTDEERKAMCRGCSGCGAHKTEQDKERLPSAAGGSRLQYKKIKFCYLKVIDPSGNSHRPQ